MTFSIYQQNPHVAHAWQVWPNPARDWIAVQGQGPATWRLHDLAGRPEQEVALKSQGERNDLTALPKGVYRYGIFGKNRQWEKGGKVVVW